FIYAIFFLCYFLFYILLFNFYKRRFYYSFFHRLSCNLDSTYGKQKTPVFHFMENDSLCKYNPIINIHNKLLFLYLTILFLFFFIIFSIFVFIPNIFFFSYFIF